MRDEMTELNYRNEGVKLPKMTELNYRNDGVKLPRIVLRKSSGDPLDWKSFKETFEAAVHSSDSISNIEKFTYLKTYLDKSSLQAIEGFPLMNENYAAAWQLLDERYGNEQLIISYHMNKIRSNYPTKCKRNAKIARYHRKKCPRVKKFRNKL